MKDIISMILSNCDSEKIAIKDNNTNISYKNLCIIINKISKIIRTKIGENKTIGIYGEKSAEFIIFMLSIIESGNYFLPLSNKYPRERIKYMLNDTNCENVFLCSQYETLDLNFDINCIAYEELLRDKCGKNESESSSLMGGYIIFTSGSTGNPKGVKVSKDALLNTITAMDDRLGQWQQKVSNVAVFAPTIFDSCLKSIFLSLCYGKTLIVIRDDLKNNLFDLVEFYKINKIDMTDITPSYFKILASTLIKMNYCPQIFFIGGERIGQTHLKCVKQLDHKFTNVECWNTYGPTESTIDVAMNLMNKNDCYDKSVGKPLRNDEIRVMNHGHYCPIGVPGEVVLSGRSLADGYINSQSNSFVEYKGKRFYRTGDNGVWQENGNLLILGRRDDQIKLHGYRVKISDVEENICNIHGIKDTVVLYYNNQLICFVTLNNNQNDDIDFTKEASRLLPSYMVPTYFKILKKLPLTSNGKIDKNVLRELYNKEKCLKNKSKQSDPNIKSLIKIWEKVLSRKIDPQASFYDMGGDSLKAIQIISELSKQNIKISIDDVLTKSVNEISKQCSNNFIKVKDKHSNMISPMQDWILKRSTKNINYRNLTFAFKLDSKVRVKKVSKIVQEIMKKHPELRARFNYLNGMYIQRINSLISQNKLRKAIIWDFNDIALPLHDLILNMENSMDITKGNLIRVAVYNNLIIFCVHQLVIDHYSFQILVKEFFDNYYYDKPIANEEITYSEWVTFCQKSNKNFLQRKENTFAKTTEHSLNIYGELRLEKRQFNVSDKLIMKEKLLYNFEKILINKFHIKSFVVGSIGRVQAIKEGLNVSNTIGRFGNMQEFKILKSETRKQFTERYKKFEKNMDSSVWAEKQLQFETDVSFNWMGDYSQLLNKWKVTPVNIEVSNICPFENYPFSLKVSGYIYQNKLNIEVMYNPQKYQRQAIIDLINTIGKE